MGARLGRAASVIIGCVMAGGLAGGLFACAEGPAADPAPPPDGTSDISTPVTEDGGPPRRPARRYYMTRTELRCEVYFIEDDAISTPVPTPCPAYIDVGERIRLSGRSCFREGVPAREQPVVCPSAIIDMEAHERRARAAEADAGAADGGGNDAGARDAGRAAAPAARKTPRR